MKIKVKIENLSLKEKYISNLPVFFDKIRKL